MCGCAPCSQVSVVRSVATAALLRSFAHMPPPFLPPHTIPPQSSRLLLLQLLFLQVHPSCASFKCLLPPSTAATGVRSTSEILPGHQHCQSSARHCQSSARHCCQSSARHCCGHLAGARGTVETGRTMNYMVLVFGPT